ncbi:multifunctional beta-oxidation protein [Ephemerocybe angulata]|uniref:Multifunctional beta-oxidation protein n=1 Tax=Ephemerocybe angulata TaxID=980116 RepID=A0A8H6MAP4_9AGAR|nr:multifunctional beta-oxidation protein [Tulosesus angulatus]
MSLSFKGHTVVVTGAGGGLGKAYSLAFASRGANVVVNDFNAAAAQKVVDEITSAGGKAVVNTSSVTDGEAVIKTAVDNFGTVTILINNAGILRDKSFKSMSDKEWDQVIEGSSARLPWPIFRKQKFGRVINTASAAGIYGNFGQANYSAAKMGAKYGIKSTAIAPVRALSFSPRSPEYVAPFVLALCHPEGPDANGKLFELGAGFVAEVRWERSEGAIFKTDASFTPSAVKQRWSEVTDFSKPYYPQSLTDVDSVGKLEAAKKLPSNPQSTPEVRFDGQTVIITGAGAGLGRAYALMYSKLGANVVINDVSEKGANAVAGGKAAAAVCSAEDGEKIVAVALEKFGGVHVLIANAGILRDKSFQAMTKAEWDAVIAVHLRGTYKCCKAVWPHFQKQKYGRIVNTCSQVGIYGNFGQANYSTAKAAIIGLTKSLAIEGKKYGIIANVIAPSAGTAMTSTIWPQEMVDAFKPDYVAPVVGYLTSKDNTETTGAIFEISGGWAAQTRWQRTHGHGFPHTGPFTPEDVVAKWKEITTFDERARHLVSSGESMEQVIENFNNTGNDPNAFSDPEDSTLVAEAKKHIEQPVEFNYTERDVILYNLGVGATEQELHFLASTGVPFDWLPNYNPAKLLHGEQYLKINGPIPERGSLINEARILEVLDKGKAAAVTTIVETRDKHTGELIFENQSTVFIRGAGGFGGKRAGKGRGPATAANVTPKRNPDAVVEEKTCPTQAALYRLSGDWNPLHIQPEFAAIGGFDRPILHGLCSMGISAKHVLKTYGPYKDIKVRFAGVVYPGETIVTEMWKEGSKVIFRACKVKERDAIALTAAAVTLVDEAAKAKL